MRDLGKLSEGEGAAGRVGACERGILVGLVWGRGFLSKSSNLIRFRTSFQGLIEGGNNEKMLPLYHVWCGC